MKRKLCDAVTYVSLFTPGECKDIVNMGNSLIKEEGRLQHKNGRWAKGVGRNCSIAWFHTTSIGSGWFFKKLHYALQSINDEYYGFKIKVPYSLQFTEYKAFQKYDWHFDNGAENDTRSLACVVNLQNAVLGGGTEIKANEWKNGEFSGDVGSATIFPCYLLHRAKKVYLGTRYSLVGWTKTE